MKNIKIILLIAIVMAVVIPQTAFAASKSPKVLLDGEELIFKEQAPVLINGSVFVPYKGDF